MSASLKPVEDLADNTVGKHPVLALALIIVLVILLLLSYFRKEKMSPTATMYKVSQDQQNVGWTASENRERAEGGKAPAAPAAQSGPKEGSASWAVLHNDDFHCDKREPVGDDAWGWMVGHSKDAESLRGGLSESQLSALGAGQAASVARPQRR